MEYLQGEALEELAAAWIAALTSAVEAVATTTLRLPRPEEIAEPAELGPLGGFLSVVAPSYAVQLGLIADEAQMQALATAFLRGLGGPASAREVVTVLCELLALLAGLALAAPPLSGRPRGVIGPQAFGVPFVAYGPIDVPDRALVRRRTFQVGAGPVAIVVVVYPRA